MSLRGKIFLGIMLIIHVGATGWIVWDAFYWGTPPKVLATNIAFQRGVLQYRAARTGYSFFLQTPAGDLITLSCEPVYNRWPDDGCLEPLAGSGIAQWSPDRESVQGGPLVEVGYVFARDEPRFNNVAFSVKRNGVEQLDPDSRLIEAGIDRSGRTYSEFRIPRGR